jgi:hypothetical protein
LISSVTNLPVKIWDIKPNVLVITPVIPTKNPLLS